VFDFGANWQAFSERRVNPERLAAATKSLQVLLQRDALTGLSFLDVGCGSGLFSIAAYQLGAAKVVGVDINPRSIASSTYNRDRLTPQAPLEFVEMSVLDCGRLRALGAFDLIYAWGSLHHTGAMWAAIENVLDVVRPGGTLVLAIYNRHATSRAWHAIKRIYSRLPRWAQSIVAVPFGGVIYLAKLIVTRHNPLEKQRGMDFWYDVIDWLGGYPYEYATPREIEAFVMARGFTLVQCVPAQVPTGCNEFVFDRK
jgi:2-polyprenyl-6-hydroxyphenyl methylase/3-demethylubiquinone-9 3-methyltransferase